MWCVILHKNIQVASFKLRRVMIKEPGPIILTKMVMYIDNLWHCEDHCILIVTT